MSGKSRALAVAAATAGLIGLWAPAALASTPATAAVVTSTPAVATAATSHAPLGNGGWLINGGLVNGGLVNVNLGSGNTAIGNTCKNINKTAPVGGNILAWALPISHNACVMAGGPNHF